MVGAICWSTSPASSAPKRSASRSRKVFSYCLLVSRRIPGLGLTRDSSQLNSTGATTGSSRGFSELSPPTPAAAPPISDAPDPSPSPSPSPGRPPPSSESSGGFGPSSEHARAATARPPSKKHRPNISRAWYQNFYANGANKRGHASRNRPTVGRGTEQSALTTERALINDQTKRAPMSEKGTMITT